jgi:CheY-like chemotaxis protein
MTKKNKIKVLIIDDNFSILQYLKTLLGRYNFEIKTSTDGYEGLQDSAEFKPDIIFLDLMMPNIDGIKMLQLKKVLNDIKEIPVIVISANAGRNNVLAAIEAGADRVLAKPINVKQLKATVNELLGMECFENESKESEKFIETNFKDSELVKKFEEYKDVILSAINNRDQQTLKESTTLLLDYADVSSNKVTRDLLNDLKNKDYQKPSDWMFAELLVKQIKHEINKLSSTNYINKL